MEYNFVILAFTLQKKIIELTGIDSRASHVPLMSYGWDLLLNLI